MKKILLSILGLSMGAYSVAQQVNNGGFETWGPSTYSSNDPTGWGTTNLDAFFGPNSVTQGTMSPFEGSSYAIMTTSTGYSAFSAPDTLPGVVLHGGTLFGGAANIGYTYRPLSVMFAYAANTVNNDTAGVYLELTKWNGSSSDVVGAMWYPISETSTGWNVVNIPIYYINTDTPDSMLFLGASSMGSFNLANVLPEPGSALALDAVVICQQLNPSFTTSISTLTVDFDDTTTATGPNLLWDFGDGNTSMQSDPSHTYASGGSYTVSLTVTDSCGNDSTVTQMVTVIDDTGIESGIANSTFTLYPNPSNNIFNLNLEMDEVKQINVELFDLSGRKVLQIFKGNTSLLQTQIDGTLLDRGTYVVRISSADGFIQKKITLIK